MVETITYLVKRVLMVVVYTQEYLHHALYHVSSDTPHITLNQLSTARPQLLAHFQGVVVVPDVARADILASRLKKGQG